VSSLAAADMQAMMDNKQLTSTGIVSYDTIAPQAIVPQ
jgi:hypothetical protein